MQRSEFHHAPGLTVLRLGGLALIISFIAVGIAILSFGSLSPQGATALAVLMAGALLMFSVGLWDDVWGLDARLKLILQSTIGAAVYAGGIRIDLLRNPFTGADESLGLLGFFLTIAWLVALTNLINLIDGIDGLAAGISLLLMILLAHVGMGGEAGFSVLLSIGVAGSILTFLRFNYPPARIYMGDGGAYLLGFLIGALSIVNSNKGTIAAALVAPAFALALPIADVSLTILRRFLGGLPILRPDRKHIHHRLLNLGFSRRKAVLVLYAVSSFCLVIAFEVFWLEGRLLPLFAGLVFLVLATAGHLCGFWDWSQLVNLIGNSRSLRREGRYALALATCLEMEAQRCASLRELWANFELLVGKLGFSRVHLSLADGAEVSWQSQHHQEEDGTEHQSALLPMKDGSLLCFLCVPAKVNDLVFNLRVEIAAEAWHNALLRLPAGRATSAHFSQRIPVPRFAWFARAENLNPKTSL